MGRRRRNRERVPRVLPRTCGGTVTCVMLILVPSLISLALSAWWTLTAKQAWESAEERIDHVRSQVIHIGRIIMDLNLERELTAVYITARDEDSQIAHKTQLDSAIRVTDVSVASIPRWPGTDSDGDIYRSRYIFAAMLNRHRQNVQVGNSFWSEVQFYTDVVSIFHGWLLSRVEVPGGSTLWHWLTTYTYLMSSMNYLGAEEALCSVFKAVVCFSHRETFYYANHSFSGEAMFHMYRQMYPGVREPGWTLNDHRHFFPDLYQCREEVLADMTYIGMAIDPSICDYSRKNETRLTEVEEVLTKEQELVLNRMMTLLQSDCDRALVELVVSGVVSCSLVCYLLIGHLLRCTCIKCVQMRAARRWPLKEEPVIQDNHDNHDPHHDDDLKFDSMTLQPHTKIVTFEEPEYTYRTYDEYNGKSSSIKVATV